MQRPADPWGPWFGMQKTQECLLERKEAVGRGTWFSPLPFGVHGCVPWQQGREDPQERGFGAKSSTTDLGWEGGGSAMSSFQRPLLKEGPCPVSAQQDPDMLGREAVRESCRVSMTRWPLCKLSHPAPQMGLVCATAQSGPACLLRPDTHSREQQKRQADQCRAEQTRLGRAPSAVPSSPWHTMS